MHTLTRPLFTLLLLVVATIASAQSNQTWVSGSGDDQNSCSYSAPCRTFSGAISKTATGGIISAKDPGPYSTVTITKSITIDGGGTYASILHFSTTGISINFSLNDSFGNTVVLRRLSFDADKTVNAKGVSVTGSVATNVHIADCSFRRSSVAVNMDPGAQGSTLRMNNVDIDRTSSSGIYVDGPTGTPLKATLDNVRVTQSDSPGLQIHANTNGTISNSNFSNNMEGVQIDLSTVHVNLVRTVMASNISGLEHLNTGIATVIDGCSIFGNTTGISNTGGTVIGFGNNTIANNGNNIVGNPITPVAQQ